MDSVDKLLEDFAHSYYEARTKDVPMRLNQTKLRAALLALLEAEAKTLRVEKGNAHASVMKEIKAIPLERIKELFGV